VFKEKILGRSTKFCNHPGLGILRNYSKICFSEKIILIQGKLMGLAPFGMTGKNSDDKVGQGWRDFV